MGPGKPTGEGRGAVAPDAGAILLANVYGWFQWAERGVYRLTGLAEAALRRWPGAGATAE